VRQMKYKFFLLLFFCFAFFPLITRAFASVDLVCDPGLTEENTYWILVPWGVGGHSYFWSDGIVYMNVSESSGNSWIGVKVMWGEDPHGWQPVAPRLCSDLTVHRGMVPDVFLNVRFKVGDYRVLRYPTSDPKGYAWFNVAVGLWFQRENVPYNSSDPHMCVGVNFFWMKYNGSWIPQREPVYFRGDVGNDFHSLFAANNQFVNGSWINCEVNIKQMIEDALSYWNVNYATLKAVEFYVESLGAEGEVWVDHVGVSYVPRESGFAEQFIRASLPLFIIAVCITVMKVMMR